MYALILDQFLLKPCCNHPPYILLKSVLFLQHLGTAFTQALIREIMCEDMRKFEFTDEFFAH